MKRTPSVKLRAYLALTGAGALAGLALGRPELVAVAAPFAAYVALGLALDHRPEIRVLPSAARDTVLEGEEVLVTAEVEARTDVYRLELQLQRIRRPLAAAKPPRRLARLRGGERHELRWNVRADRWGTHPLGVLHGRARDRFGLIEYELPAVRLGTLRIFPQLETLRALIGPLELQVTSGSRVSRDRGEGVEFAEVRPFAPGDRVRRVNWRITARRGAPYVSERHPERNADVILFMDTFADVGDASGSTLELSVRAAASLATAYLARKDRVGVVGFGGVLTGLGPRLGQVQLYRIIDALLGSEVVFSYVHKDVTVVPRRLLPAKALVVGITPLIDARSVGALLDLRARGFDLTVIDISPVPFAKPGRTPSDALAHRLWLLQRQALRARLQELGVPVSEWRGDPPLQVPLVEASEFRRRTPHPVSP
jgi:uncharacterized protein (DUF58 family)